MKNELKILSALILISALLFSCGKTDKTETVDNDKNKTETKTENKKDSVKTVETKKTDTTTVTKPGKPEIKWEITPAGTGQYDTPINDVYLIVNGKKQFIEKEYYNFYETPRTDYKTNDIPVDAVISCRGWWAGAGADYWVIQKSNEVLVMKREIGETIDENGEAGDFVGKPVVISKIKIDQ